VLHLQLEDLLVGEDPPVGAVDAGLGVLDDGVGVAPVTPAECLGLASGGIHALCRSIDR